MVLRRSILSLDPWDGMCSHSWLLLHPDDQTYAHSSVDDIELAARIMLGARDPLVDVLPIPFREVTIPKKLRFGYYVDGKPQSQLRLATCADIT